MAMSDEDPLDLSRRSVMKAQVDVPNPDGCVRAGHTLPSALGVAFLPTRSVSAVTASFMRCFSSPTTLTAVGLLISSLTSAVPVGEGKSSRRSVTSGRPTLAGCAVNCHYGLVTPYLRRERI